MRLFKTTTTQPVVIRRRTPEEDVLLYRLLTKQVDARRDPERTAVIRENDRVWAGRW